MSVRSMTAMSNSSKDQQGRSGEPEIKVVDRRWWAQRDDTASSDADPSAQEPWEPGKPKYVEELERQVAEKDQLLQQYITQFKEASREFDEARARLRKEVARDADLARRTLLVDLLEVIDNLDRALETARRQSGADALLQGVELVRRQFLLKLETYGVTRVDPLGERFDPTRHEAVTTVHTAEPGQDGLITGVIAPGYLIAGDLLRPAQVAVAQAPALT
ncbi:MAG: nucleotide exchange factor GrpE [Luteitalea sp.]|nr:nucleotide exchange factor GrpE [Luteitalea sp.]